MKSAPEEIVLEGELTDIDLAKAVARLRCAGTIRLKRVILRMRKSLRIDKPLTILGQDPDTSWILGPGDGIDFGLIFQGPGPWFLSHFSVAQWKGDGGVKVESGQIDIQKCRFAHCPNGAGLFVDGASRGRVDDCELLGNRSGIVLAGQSDMLVTNNLCNQNIDEIVFQDQSKGAALNNEFRANSGRELWINGLARPILDGDLRSHSEGLIPTREIPQDPFDDPVLETVLERLFSRGRVTGQLSSGEVLEALADFEMTPDRFDVFLKRLVREGIEVVEPEE